MTVAGVASNGSPTIDAEQRARLEDGQRCRASALEYLREGWSVLPLCPPDHVGVGKEHGRTCQSHGKRPLIPWKEFQDRPPTVQEVNDWWHRQCNANVGIALGPVSGLIRVDVEGEAGEAELLRQSRGDVPPTLEFTSGKGRGLLFAIPQGVELRTTTQPLAVHEELRLQGKGAQTVLPPSRHPSGRLYMWRAGHGPTEIEPAPAPAWILRAMATEQQRKRASAVQGDILDGSRNTTLASLAGTMRRRGMTEAAIEAALLAENAERCDPPLEESEVRTIARSIASYPPGGRDDASPDDREQAPQESDSADGATSGEQQPPRKLGYQIILEHFRQVYDPVYRKGNGIYSRSLAREVKAAEVTGGAGIALVRKLRVARDAPHNDNGVIWNKLPGFFRTWASSAWHDMLRSLPDEDQAGEIDELSAEEFRARVAIALQTMIALGQRYKDGERTEIERRPVLDWCLRFAQPGRWSDVRGHQVWCCLRDGAEPRQDRLRVALRTELFAQLGRSDLSKLTQTKFARLATLYGVGAAGKVNGRRVVVLAPEWLSEHLERPEAPSEDDLTDPLAHARTRDNERQNVQTDVSTGGGEC